MSNYYSKILSKKNKKGLERECRCRMIVLRQSLLSKYLFSCTTFNIIFSIYFQFCKCFKRLKIWDYQLYDFRIFLIPQFKDNNYHRICFILDLERKFNLLNQISDIVFTINCKLYFIKLFYFQTLTFFSSYFFLIYTIS